MQFPDHVTRLCGSRRFAFGCHPGIGCFTECCRELELLLTPYDVLCLRRELRMSGADFIDRYVVVEQDDQGPLPRLYLGMVDDGRASCPFITARGCRVYNSRPGACRAYPVGRGVTLDPQGTVREIHVLVREEHCLGFAQADSYTAAEWFENQGLTAYNEINDAMLVLLQHDGARPGRKFSRQQRESFLLALYRLDEFRQAVSSQPFQDRYRLHGAALRQVLADDLSLLRFGISWLAANLFAETI